MFDFILASDFYNLSNPGKEEGQTVDLPTTISSQRGLERGGDQEEEDRCRGLALGVDLQAHQVMMVNQDHLFQKKG